MAVYTVANGGGNINAGATYVGGVAPTSTDSIDFTATSGQLTVNVSFDITDIDFTNYTNTFTLNNTIRIVGNVTLSPTMTIVFGAGSFIVNGNSTLTSNGKVFNGPLLFQGAGVTYTFADYWTVDTFSNANSHTLNGSSVNVQVSFVCNTAIVGTTIINLVGTGTWSGTGRCGNKLNINTAGTITVSGTVGAGDLTYITGTVVTTGSTLSTTTLNATWDTNGIVWNNVLNGAGITTLTSALTINGTLTSATANTATFNGSNIILNGSFVAGNTGTGTGGTSNILYQGTGTWSGAGAIRNNLTINTAGTITISGSVAYNTGTLTYIAGTVVTTGSTLSIQATTTLNTDGIIWNSIAFSGGTVTLLSDLTLNGTLTTQTANVTINGFNIYANGSLTVSILTVGTTVINLTGTGTWSGNSTSILKNNLNINTTGILTISGNVHYTTGTLTYITGAVITTGSQLFISLDTTLDTNSLNWNTVTFQSGSGGPAITFTLTLLSNLLVNNLIPYMTNSQIVSINGFSVLINGNLTTGTTAGICAGTSILVIQGTGTWNCGGYTHVIRNNININTDGIFTINGAVYYNTGTLTYTKGKINPINNANLILTASTTLINFHKLKIKNVTIIGGSTITMNEFFCGSPDIKTLVRSNSNTVNYNITFTDTVPKKAFHVNVKNGTVTNRNQLNIINRDGNAGSNAGVIFGEIGRNGFPLNQFPIEPTYSFGDGMLSNMNN